MFDRVAVLKALVEAKFRNKRRVMKFFVSLILIIFSLNVYGDGVSQMKENGKSLHQVTYQKDQRIFLGDLPESKMCLAKRERQVAFYSRQGRI